MHRNKEANERDSSYDITIRDRSSGRVSMAGQQAKQKSAISAFHNSWNEIKMLFITVLSWEADAWPGWRMTAVDALQCECNVELPSRVILKISVQ